MPSANVTEQRISPGKLPAHVAVIMDGNGRWAQKRGLPRAQGHRAGMDAVRTVVTECRSLGIPYLTLYAFSRENWHRPKEEVSFLFELFRSFLKQELPLLMEQDIRLAFIGEKDDLPFPARKALDYALEKTRPNNSMNLTLAISYSGREEILRAARCLLESRTSPEHVTEETFRNSLYDPSLPDPDLVIRTSGEKRISNFLLFQSAYAEYFFSPVLWPDFTSRELHMALQDFSRRDRRYGRTDGQSCVASRKENEHE